MVTDADTLDLLADVARSFATPDVPRARRLRDAGGGLDRAMWSRLADNGWLSILVPEALGGAGLGVDAAAVVARRLGYAAFPEPFVAAGVLPSLVLAAAGGTERLAPFAAGELVVAVADGRVPVADADAYIVRVGDALHWVSADALSMTSRRTADGGCLADLGAATGEPLAAAAALDEALDTARICSAAEMLGLMDRVLELTLEYLAQRHQFGKPIGSFQALQHRAVDMWIQRELASAAVAAAVRVHLDPDSTPRHRAMAASSAKARTASAGPSVCKEALQLHGAIGYTDEYDLGVYLNRALTLAPYLGTASGHRRRYVQLVREPA